MFLLAQHVDTFPLELAGYIVAAAIVTEAVLLLLAGLRSNPFVTKDKDSDCD